MILLVGPSAVGKTEVGKALSRLYGYNKLITYTTRPKRVGEVNGIDYHFIDVCDFLAKKESDFFFENVNYSGNYYGTALSDIDVNKYIIVDPEGLKKYKKSDLFCIAFYLEALEEVRASRMKNRNDSEENIQKRLLLDRTHFPPEIKAICNHIISVDIDSVDEIADKIHNLYKSYKM